MKRTFKRKTYASVIWRQGYLQNPVLQLNIHANFQELPLRGLKNFGGPYYGPNDFVLCINSNMKNFNLQFEFEIIEYSGYFRSLAFDFVLGNFCTLNFIVVAYLLYNLVTAPITKFSVQ